MRDSLAFESLNLQEDIVEIFDNLGQDTQDADHLVSEFAYYEVGVVFDEDGNTSAIV